MSCVPVLSLFTIVSFKNEACLSSGTGTNGTCYSSNECAKLGGTSSGTCASGFGVCCTLTGYCGGATSANNTYFASSGADTSPCQFKVCKSSDDICQVR